MRKFGRKDANQKLITDSLAELGVSIWDTSMCGDGKPDFVCGWRGVNYAFECKNPNVDSTHRKLTPDEQKFHASWHGQIAVISTLEECLDLMGIWKSGKDYKAGKGR